MPTLSNCIETWLASSKFSKNWLLERDGDGAPWLRLDTGVALDLGSTPHFIIDESSVRHCSHDQNASEIEFHMSHPDFFRDLSALMTKEEERYVKYQ